MTIKEWIKKDEVMDIIKGLPQDLWEEYIYMLKGVWCDEDMHIETLQKQEHDGCEGCKYTHKDQYEMPCLMCKQSKKDLWERREP